MKQITTLVVAVVWVLALAGQAFAAQTVHLELMIDGNDIIGDSTVTSLDREGTIECLAYEHELNSPRDAASGRATGKRQHGPIVIRKRIDQTSPLLIKALCMNEVVAAKFRFFAPDPAGSGAEVEIYQVSIQNAFISRVKQVVVDVLSEEGANQPPIEEVAFTFQNIRWLWLDGGAMHTDALRDEATGGTLPATPAATAPGGRRLNTVPRLNIRRAPAQVR